MNIWNRSGNGPNGRSVSFGTGARAAKRWHALTCESVLEVFPVASALCVDHPFANFTFKVLMTKLVDVVGPSAVWTPHFSSSVLKHSEQ